MSMVHQLSCLLTRGSEAEPIDDAVQPTFQPLQQVIASNTGLAFCLRKHPAELPFQQSVDALQLLFLAQLRAILRGTLASLPMLPRRVAPTFDRALLSHASRTFEKQFLAFSSAQPTDWTPILGHCGFLLVNRYSLFVKRQERLCAINE